MHAPFPFAYSASEHEEQIVAHFGEAGLRPPAAPPRADIRTFVICFTNRCGSNLLADLIATHPAFGLAGESLGGEATVKFARRHGHRELATHLGWLAAARASPEGVFGVKVAWQQLYFLVRTGMIPAAFGAMRFVHITRRDTLRQAVSHLIASQTRAWTSWRAWRVDPAKVRVDEADVASMVGGIHRSNARFRALFDLCGITPVDVVYEDLVADLQGEGDRVLRELGFAGAGARVDPAALRLERQSGALNDEIVRRVRERYRLWPAGDAAG